MSEPDRNIASTSRKLFRDRSILTKTGIILTSILAGILLLIIFAIIGTSLWLTPNRLTKIINTEASRNLDADVTAYNARLSIWSTFPYACLDLDSLRIISRSLDNVPDHKLADLPLDASFLASAHNIHGGINIVKLLKKSFDINDLRAEDLELNLVMVSDSVSNFNILKHTRKLEKIPYFTIRQLTLFNPRNIRIYSLPAKAEGCIDLSRISLTRNEASPDTYTLALKGDADAVVNKVNILKDFPFDLSGQTDIAFNPFRISLTDFKTVLGNTEGKMNLEIQTGKVVKLNRFSYKLNDFKPFELLKYIKGLEYSLPDSTRADILMNASATLTAPYDFSSSRLPSMLIDFNVPDGEIEYIAKQSKTYLIRHSGIKGKVAIDGAHPDSSYAKILPFNVNGEDTNVQLKANISNILSDPEIRIALNGSTDAELTGKIISPLKSYALAGTMNTDIVLDVRLSDIKRSTLENIILNGDISFHNYRMRFPNLGVAASGKELNMNFGGKASDIYDKTIANGIFDMKATADRINIMAKGYDINISGLDFSSKMKEDHPARLSEISALMPFDLDIKTTAVDIANKRDTVRISMRNMLVDGQAVTRPGKAVLNQFTANITGDSINAVDGKTRMTMNELSSRLSASEMQKSIVSRKYAKPEKWTADSNSMNFIDHSAEYLSVNLPQKAIDIIGKWKSYMSLKVKSGTLLTPALPLRNGFGDLDIEASFDSVKLNNLHFNSQDTRLKAKGKVSNLRQFLTSRSVAPLQVALDVAIDTVRINQLCGAYNHGLKLTHGPNASVLTVIPDTLTSSDTVSLLVPRNIIADIKASAMMTEYTDLYLHDLSTGISMRDGKFKIKDLGIASSFGALKLNFEYDTSDIQRMGMNLQGSIADVNLVNFFSKFHTLLLMMPQMRNLKGNLSTMAEAKLLLFPNMYLNMPSIWADVYVHGDHLLLHQDSFIRRITKMMLIPNSEDIRLSNINIHASVHDNLMELYPFGIRFDRYHLQFGGLNNFDGDMYYHLGIDKSPVPFPFGINIIGNFKHPEMRFGGASFKINKGEEITASVMEDKRVNLLLELKCLVRKFIEKAAEADTTPASFYVY